MGADGLTWLNDLPPQAARQALLECCSAPSWADQMAAARPYASVDDVVRQSGEVVAALTVADLAEALAGHPRIGQRPDAGDRPRQAAGDRLGQAAAEHSRRAADSSRREQSGVDQDDAATMRALAEANLEYERRFGHIYLVCASGRTGKELLDVLRGRLENDPEDEWQVVRTELQKINALRLQRLLAS
jgi:2-oxo-4-hydroxy-4-carboxy-5-ureidoimidazoline decarboxylase